MSTDVVHRSARSPVASRRGALACGALLVGALAGCGDDTEPRLVDGHAVSDDWWTEIPLPADVDKVTSIVTDGVYGNESSATWIGETSASEWPGDAAFTAAYEAEIADAGFAIGPVDPPFPTDKRTRQLTSYRNDDFALQVVLSDRSSGRIGVLLAVDLLGEGGADT